MGNGASVFSLHVFCACSPSVRERDVRRIPISYQFIFFNGNHKRVLKKGRRIHIDNLQKDFSRRIKPRSVKMSEDGYAEIHSNSEGESRPCSGV